MTKVNVVGEELLLRKNKMLIDNIYYIIINRIYRIQIVTNDNNYL